MITYQEHFWGENYRFYIKKYWGDDVPKSYKLEVKKKLPKIHKKYKKDRIFIDCFLKEKNKNKNV